MITERLRYALRNIESLSSELQDEIAEQIEEMTEPLDYPGDHLPAPEVHATEGLQSPTLVELPRSVRDALALAGAWSDLQDDDEFVALEKIRHANPPSPPVEEQLAWLDLDEAGAQ